MKAICEKHGAYEAETVEIFGTTIQSNCPLCEKELDAEIMKQAEKDAQETEKQRLIARGIEPEFFTATLENYKPENEMEAEALNAAKQLRDGAINKLLLLGSNGTGKTHLACALAKECYGIRITMFELSAKIRAGFNEGRSEVATLDDLLNYNLVIIDEVGRTKGSDAEKNWLSYLVDKIHTRSKKLILISNRQTARHLPADRKGEAFEYFFDNDVISRLKQNSKIVEVKGRDRRCGA